MIKETYQIGSPVYRDSTSATSLAGTLVYSLREFLWQLATWAILRFERLQEHLKPSPVHGPNTGEQSDHLSSELSPIERRVDMIDQALTSGHLEWWQAWNLREKVLRAEAS